MISVHSDQESVIVINSGSMMIEIAVSKTAVSPERFSLFRKGQSTTSINFMMLQLVSWLVYADTWLGTSTAHLSAAISWSVAGPVARRLTDARAAERWRLVMLMMLVMLHLIGQFDEEMVV